MARYNDNAPIGHTCPIRDKEYLQEEVDELKAKIEELEAQLSEVEMA